MTNGSSQSPVLRVENLDLSYGDYDVLSGVSFEVQDGSCLVVMGGSGCGKSTLLKSLVGLLEPSGGEVFFESNNLWPVNKLEGIAIISPRFSVCVKDAAGGTIKIGIFTVTL